MSSSVKKKRIVTPDVELNRVLAAVLYQEVILLQVNQDRGNAPLFLQIGLIVENTDYSLYQRRESEQQIRMRRGQIKKWGTGNLMQKFQIIFTFFTETSTTSHYSKEIKKLKPQVVIVDLFRLYNHHIWIDRLRTISQIRECASEFSLFDKMKQGTPVFWSAILAKDGNIACPKILEICGYRLAVHRWSSFILIALLPTFTETFLASTAELGILWNDRWRDAEVKQPQRDPDNTKRRAASGSANRRKDRGPAASVIEVPGAWHLR